VGGVRGFDALESVSSEMSAKLTEPDEKCFEMEVIRIQRSNPISGGEGLRAGARLERGRSTNYRKRGERLHGAGGGEGSRREALDRSGALRNRSGGHLEKATTLYAKRAYGGHG